MTRPTAEECIVALRAVKRMFQKQCKEGEDYGICYAIGETYLNDKISWKMDNYLRLWIRQMLGNTLFLECWQKDRGIREDFAYYDRSLVPVRLAWLNWMINECKKELK